MVAHTFDPSPGEEEEVGESLEFKVGLLYIVPGQPGLHRKTLSPVSEGG